MEYAQVSRPSRPESYLLVREGLRHPADSTNHPVIVPTCRCVPLRFYQPPAPPRPAPPRLAPPRPARPAGTHRIALTPAL